MKTRFLILVNLFILKLAMASHPIHVSIVNMDLLSDSNLINYSVCLYYEDLQSLINYKYNTLIDFSHQERMTFKEQQSILEYLNSSFILTDSQNKPLSSEFLHWKVEDDLVWFYFCVKEYTVPEKLTIENKLMTDLFSDQKNLLIINNGDLQQGYEFNKRNTLYTLTWKNG